MDYASRQRLSLARTLSKTPKPLLAAAFAFFVAALFASAFPDAPGRAWTSLLATLAMALPAFVALVGYLGARSGLIALFTLGLFGYAIEAVGVVTGFPYGGFEYSDALGGKFFGLVPYLLPVSYVPLVIGAVGAAWRFGSSRLAWVFRSALLLILLDGVLDPGAVQLGFWSWSEDGLYYGVPLSNYFGWLLSGVIASYLLTLFTRFGRSDVLPRAGMLDGAILGLAFWIGVAVFGGLVIPVVLGISLFVYLIHARSRLPRGARV
ncbi:carotenoid biosynthesis protein [Rubrobacter indicoceani]|uniref:carotenoid biosynthesis protein n=1 Tax=Rubrobacter indicoceani TaxID=2051957 RepID=UPI000E5AD9E5|nr:carotenoid biosynthesis protein [Rubrobacter indicoceani]